MEPARQPTPAQPPQLPHLQVRYCGVHGLVIGPEGRCIICKRNMAEPEAGSGGRTTLAAVLIVGAVLGGVLVYKGVSASAPPAPAPTFQAAPVAVAVTSRPALVPEGEDPDTMQDEQRRGEAAAARSIEKQRDMEDATRAVKVRVYVKDPCDLCRTGEAYLKDRGVSYTELDVDRDPMAADTLRKLRPDPTVPTFEVDGEVVAGFGPRELGAAIARAAEHRLHY